MIVKDRVLIAHMLQYSDMITPSDVQSEFTPAHVLDYIPEYTLYKVSFTMHVLYVHNGNLAGRYSAVVVVLATIEVTRRKEVTLS